MAASRPAGPRLLLVEGADDEHVIRHLHEQTQGAVDFDIEQLGGTAQIREEIEAHAKAPGRTALGIVVDANSDTAARWQSVRDALMLADIRLPLAPDPPGTVVPSSTAGVPKVGVWLMPDNQASGELEDFLAALIPAGDDVWRLAQQYVEQVPGDQLSKPAKARLHAWLAVRTDGGRLGTSISAGAFDLEQPAARSFVDWLRRVFQ
ncbi:DUF3226 domain-containing protein [Candidatus Poriferisodalis sp.]|uniref:DUF3226 domain-containing protein n=1 Tax=Candidatus Poriferisodalis sp. TaxID=3101277 RepID=UPI003B5C8A4A